MPNTFIVGDAGGSNTQWRVVKNGYIKQFETIGFNAYTHTLSDLKKDIKHLFGHMIEKDIPTFFYAAGVDTPSQQAEISSSMTELFGNEVKVENDLVGVARSLCGKEEGNICILGTGSNACFYDGQSVNKINASLGFILGDEGSGTYLGKKLLIQLFRGQLPPEVVKNFKNRFNLTLHDVIQKVYCSPLPNQYLASFAPFIHENRNNSSIYNLVYNAFEDFFMVFLSNNPHSDKTYHFSGSIAFYFANILRQLGLDKGIVIKNIIVSPISGLVLYHQKYD